MLLCLFPLHGRAATAPELKPDIIPFTLPVYNAYTMPTPYCVGIEIFISAFERQFVTLYFTNQNSISVDTVPLDEYRGGTKCVLGSQNGTDLVLLQSKEIAVLNRENNRVMDEYTTALPRADAQVEYFQGKMIGGDR